MPKTAQAKLAQTAPVEPPTLPPEPRSHRQQVADNLFNLDAFRRMVRHLVLSPLWLGLTSLPTLLAMVGMLKEEFLMPKSIVFLIYVARTFIWGGILILLLPRLARFFMSRNLPFLLAYVVLLGGAVAKLNLLNLAFLPEMTLEIAGIRFFRQMILGIFLTAVLVRFADHEIRSLGSDPDLVPVWRPVPESRTAMPAPVLTADLSLLEPGLSGRILSLQAQNQYVEVVTPEKTHLLRMPFHQAVALMPHAAGHRVHRSWWLANEVPIKLVKIGQSYEAQDEQGRSYPVSKPNLDLVRSVIERNQAAAPPGQG